MADFWQWQGDADTGAGYIKPIDSNGTELFTATNPGDITNKGTVGANTIYSGTNTWTSGTTATSGQTLSVGTLTATTTSLAHEIIVTNDGPYDITADVYKIISSGATINADMGVNFLIPATKASAGVTVNGKALTVRGLFNVNLGLAIRMTVTANITATVTNGVIIKETDI